MPRNVKKLQQRSKFTIITNGKESERNYFEAVRGAKRSIFDIAVEFDNADPISLVKRAIREKQGSNQVWIVFDKDEFPNEAVYEAMRLARKNGIGVAFSNAAFEVWLIDHFREFSAEKTADELMTILDSALREHGCTKGYQKNDSDLIKKEFMPRIDKAVLNADVSLQKRIAEHNKQKPGDRNYPYCDWNSCNMKLLHTFDWHLGASETEKSLHDDQVFFIDGNCRVVQAEQIGGVIVACDVFDYI